MLKNKNILFLVHSYNSFQKDQIEVLAQYFNKVYVLVRYKPIAEISNLIPFSFLLNHRKKSVINLVNTPSNVFVYPVSLWYLPTDNGYKALGEKHLEQALKIIIKNKIEFDLIHAHFIWSAGYVGIKLKELFNKPCIITGHGEDVYDYPFRDKHWKTITENVLNSSDYILTVSNSNLSYLKRLNVTKKITVFPNGYNNKLFYPLDKQSCRTKLNLPSEKKIILCIGYLTKIKGHKYLIDTIKKIYETDTNILCIIIGEGELMSTLRRQIKELDLHAVVKMIGSIRHENLNSWINSCDLLVLPSIKESFGVVQLEAIACGKPVVATKNGGSNDLITTDFGFLCEVENSTDLAEKMISALNKEWNKEHIVNLSKKYLWENICKLIIKIYILFIDNIYENI